ncbi:CheR family methyltransferase [Novosphingobium pokkalii]|uniref:Chemotaxis protein methyltransferase n=1 Tax=Novosphingobium pokkalii TaxID=1770194 RepID=A0ABV7V1Y1_9SPHN|nr:protein-glutamate O-methyltransferase CheR [Novosphingobium pokkalii]GHC90655.1 chemotaxis protein methyltransferase [Novosphingobium pokkalii]
MASPPQAPPLHRIAAPRISAEDVVVFCDFFYKKTGISMDASRRYFIDKRLEDRMAANDCNSFREYLSLVKFQPGGAEMQALINEMTVNETYFFREDYQFACLTRRMLDEIADRKDPRRDRIRIWSIPCSTGEEPYSIAISILEDWPRASDFDIEIIASDIDTRALARAREGIYQARALHRVSPRIRDTYFRKLDGENWQVVPSLRESIDFGVINVSSPTQMARMRGIDVIFCRNLLIYFDDLSRRQTAEHFFDALNPGGFVALGHSESMSRISNIFVPRKFPEALVHQRPLP